jgi:hypothetical protein
VSEIFSLIVSSITLKINLFYFSLFTLYSRLVILSNKKSQKKFINARKRRKENIIGRERECESKYEIVFGLGGWRGGFLIILTVQILSFSHRHAVGLVQLAMIISFDATRYSILI